jgi:hypothetical protein
LPACYSENPIKRALYSAIRLHNLRVSSNY